MRDKNSMCMCWGSPCRCRRTNPQPQRSMLGTSTTSTEEEMLTPPWGVDVCMLVDPQAAKGRHTCPRDKWNIPSPTNMIDIPPRQ